MVKQLNSKDNKMNETNTASKNNTKKIGKKIKDKTNNMCLFKEETYKKVISWSSTKKMVTVSIMMEEFSINGSLARAALSILVQKGIIKCIITHNRQCIYTGVNVISRA